MILAYLRERFPLRFFGPVAFVLAVCALGGITRPVELAITTLAALLLLAQFRIWDDLMDRRTDAVAHPQRVLVRAEDHHPLLVLGLALVPINLALAFERDSSLASAMVLCVLHAALAAYYAGRGQRTVFTDQILLAKYPTFVCVLSSERLASSPLPVALTAILVYVAASAYEAWHDPVSPLAQFIGGRS